jgi:uncharacterized protein
MKRAHLVIGLACGGLVAIGASAMVVRSLRRTEHGIGRSPEEQKKNARPDLDCEARKDDCVPLGLRFRLKDRAQASKHFTRACEAGIARGCTELGLVQRKDQTLLAKAAAHFEKACDLGDQKGCARLGYANVYAEGVPMTPESRDIGVALAKKACESGEAEGCAVLAMFGRYSIGPLSGADVAAMAARACEGGALLGCQIAGDFRRDGVFGVVRDGAAAKEFYRRGCHDDVIDLCVNVLAMHTVGIDGKKDGTLAVDAGTRGCDGGDGDACSALGALYVRGDLVAKDPPRALELYRRGLELGSFMAMGALSDAYLTGAGGLVAIDVEKARKYAEEACAHGEGGGCNNLGVITYQGGAGITADPAAALALFEKACDLALEVGCRSAGELHEGKSGVPADAAASHKYFMRACDLGDASSCIKVGRAK